MTIFRWIIGVIAALLAAGSLLSLVVFLIFDIKSWLGRARTLRRGLYSAVLVWFNVEVWARVIGAFVTW